ncbi:carboxypeptidase-like regulatory domain-containing protein [Winogradskyella sp. A2]|uniref:carboxypeptidase-like regulatory domain-containing protein n=1 Tax=Winogradskyella sp. A2 TaxID=3366944 RepID=UPI00398C3E23
MKSTKTPFVLLLFAITYLTSCNLDDGPYLGNDTQESIPETFSQYFGNDISRDFLGTVVDENNAPIAGATISVGGQVTQTDINGIFILQDADVYERFGYVKASKPGYLNGSRALVPSEGTNKVRIMLLPETIAGTVSSGQPGEVELSNGSSVNFDGNFMDENGTTYEGNVNVIMHHLDPTDDDMELQMPGMLYAQNEDGAERMLQTLGMLAVELKGESGEDLNLAEGSSSEIRIPVDPSLMGMAPATIPLWYFDEEHGYWKEEGEATLQGNEYVGVVTHFSFWNCDIPAEAITLCVNVVDIENNPLDSLILNITSSTYGTTSGITDEKGEVCGLVPRNESLLLEVYDFTCGQQLIFSESIGPFSEDESINFTLATTNEIIQTITGTINNCNGENLENGYVVINYNDQENYKLVNNGNFEFNIISCESINDFSLRAVDLNTFQTSATYNYTFNTSTTNIDSINTCISQEEYIIYFIDNSNDIMFYDNIDVDLNENNFTVLRRLEPGSDMKFLTDLPNELGQFITSSTNGMILNVFYPVGSSNQYVSIGNYGINIEITYIGAGVGDLIDMNFNGTFQDPGGVEHTIEGQVHVRIDE